MFNLGPCRFCGVGCGVSGQVLVEPGAELAQDIVAMIGQPDYPVNLGFEVYGLEKRKGVLVYYVEAPTLKDLEKRIKAAEALEGIVKAYVIYVFTGDEEKKKRIEQALTSGEMVIDEATQQWIKEIIDRLTGKRT